MKYYFKFCVIFLISCALLAFFVFRQHHKPEKKTAICLKEQESIGPITPVQKKSYLQKGIDASIEILKAKGASSTYKIYGRNIRCEALLDALLSLKNDLMAGMKLSDALKRNFLFLSIEKDGRPEPLLLTGYYQPELEARMVKKPSFTVPVLKKPYDLVMVALKDFGIKDRGVIWGRVSGDRLVPYFTRKAIRDNLDRFEPLCWLRSEVDLLELQIQGSGIIIFPEGRRFIHYAASNGWPYLSIGRELIKEGLLTPGQLTWQGIRKWAEKNREKFLEVLDRNKRYVFFKWEKDGPIGCFGHKLVNGVSVALDRHLFPPGMPILLKVSLPNFGRGLDWMKTDSGYSSKAVLLLFNHDTGSAIKGPFRADLYVGSGQKALALAGRLKNKAEFYLLLPRR